MTPSSNPEEGPAPSVQEQPPKVAKPRAAKAQPAADQKPKSIPRYTEAFRLTPSSLVSTAAADIAKHARNKEVASRRYLNEAERPRIERLGFYPADVRGATKPTQVLTRAYRRCQRSKNALVHRQKNRALLYDRMLIAEALVIAQTRERQEYRRQQTMSVAHIETVLSKIGIFQTDSQRYGRGWRTFWSSACDKCNATEKLSVKSPVHPEAVHQSFMRNGWHFAHSKAICPSCAKHHRQPIEETEELNNGHGQIVIVDKLSDPGIQPMQQPKPEVQKTIPLATVGKLMPFLTEHYDDEVKGYRSNWSDQKIAAASGYSPDIVKQLRETVYGPMTDPEIAALRADIDSLSEMLSGLVRRLDMVERKR